MVQVEIIDLIFMLKSYYVSIGYKKFIKDWMFLMFPLVSIFSGMGFSIYHFNLEALFGSTS